MLNIIDIEFVNNDSALAFASMGARAKQELGTSIHTCKIKSISILMSIA